MKFLWSVGVSSIGIDSLLHLLDYDMFDIFIVEGFFDTLFVFFFFYFYF